MKLYDSKSAPNPRRARIFLAEKGITVPTEQVDIMTMQHKTPEYAAINPLQRMPALVLDDGTKEQGRGTRLTALGERLLWVRERINARLAPHLENRRTGGDQRPAPAATINPA